MVRKELEDIFRHGSKTYFNSSLFFPERIRERVIRLYAFVRVADDYVDGNPQDTEGFERFKRNYQNALLGQPVEDWVVAEFVKLSAEMNFNPEWAEAFLRSMEMDLHKSKYETLQETLEYIYGSAEVIGLFMARIMELPEVSFPFAQKLGRAMQYINFIRDIAEDHELNRCYIPADHIAGYGLPDITEKSARNNPGAFSALLRNELVRYRKWQCQAEEGYRFIPKRYLIPIKTAADMYVWTANRIEADPLVVFERKVKPSKLQIILRGTLNTFYRPEWNEDEE